MIRLLINIVCNGLILIACSKILSTTLQIQSMENLILYSIILYIFNLLIKPIVKLINFPLKILTLGVSSVIIQACIILFCVSFSNIILQNNGIIITNDFISYIKVADRPPPLAWLKIVIIKSRLTTVYTILIALILNY